MFLYLCFYICAFTFVFLYLCFYICVSDKNPLKRTINIISSNPQLTECHVQFTTVVSFKALNEQAFVVSL